MPRTPAAPSEPPRVLSLFIELPRGAVKHGYSFQHAAKVPAPYLVYGTQPAIGRIAAARAAAGLLTELREIDIGGLRNLSAASLGVSPAALELAARSAPTRLPPRPLPPPSEPVSMTRARALPQPLGRRDTLPLVGARPDLALQAAAPRDGDAR